MNSIETNEHRIKITVVGATRNGPTPFTLGRIVAHKATGQLTVLRTRKTVSKGIIAALLTSLTLPHNYEFKSGPVYNMWFLDDAAVVAIATGLTNMDAATLGTLLVSNYPEPSAYTVEHDEGPEPDVDEDDCEDEDCDDENF